MNSILRTKSKMKEEIGLQVVHYDHFVTAYTDVSKHIRFLLQQPGIQDALNFPNQLLVSV